MTQPPPPQQPPQQGAFGPPPDQQPPQRPGFGTPPQPPQSPQPAYGYPQAPQPPQQPGYGTPQPPQPQGPPPQQPYGYPGQQLPAPYGQPAQPHGGQPGPYAQQPDPYGPQAGYGYPQGPVPPYPPVGQPSGSGKSKAPVIVVAVVAALALVVGGVWFATSGSGGDKKKDDTASSSGATGGGQDTGGGGADGKGEEKVPSDPSARQLFQLASPKVDGTTVVSGSWLTDKAYVKTGVAEINGYDPDKGTRLWTIKLPGPVCEASTRTTDDNRTAVLFQPRMPPKNSSAGCTQVAAIDLAAGRKLWTKTVDYGGQPMNFSNVTVSADTVAVGGLTGGAAFDVATGKALWAPKEDDSCRDAGYGGGEKLVAVLKCGEYGQRQLHIQTIDPRSGEVISEYKMAKGIEYAAVVSTNPLVVAADAGDTAGDGSEISDFYSIDGATGRLITHISAPGKQYAARCDSISAIEDCSGLAVGNDRLYLPTEEHSGAKGYSRTNEIVAFDLTTGKQTGQRADAGDGTTLTPLRMDKGNVIAYKTPSYDKGGQIVSIDGGSFRQTTLLQNPAANAQRMGELSMSPDIAEFLYSRGRLYMASHYADKALGAGDRYLALAFGTG